MPPRLKNAFWIWFLPTPLIHSSPTSMWDGLMLFKTNIHCVYSATHCRQTPSERDILLFLLDKAKYIQLFFPVNCTLAFFFTKTDLRLCKHTEAAARTNWQTYACSNTHIGVPLIRTMVTLTFMFWVSDKAVLALNCSHSNIFKTRYRSYPKTLLATCS